MIMTPEDRQRLQELAKHGARWRHEGGIMYSAQKPFEKGHVDDGMLGLGFETCPHPDCVLVRTGAVETPAQEAADWRLAFRAANEHVGQLQAELEALRAASSPVPTPQDGIRYDAETETFVARYTVLTAGRTEDEARAALASAVRLLAETWPPRAVPPPLHRSRRRSTEGAR